MIPSVTSQDSFPHCIIINVFLTVFWWRPKTDLLPGYHPSLPLPSSNFSRRCHISCLLSLNLIPPLLPYFFRLSKPRRKNSILVSDCLIYISITKDSKTYSHIHTTLVRLQILFVQTPLYRGMHSYGLVMF